jgi:hypothetical protein
VPPAAHRSGPWVEPHIAVGKFGVEVAVVVGAVVVPAAQQLAVPFSLLTRP